MIDADALVRLLPMEVAIDALEAGFGAERLPEAPLRSHIETSGGALLLMPAHGRDGVGVKLVTLTDANPERGLPFIHAAYVLFDPGTQAPVAMLDGAALTALRTGAVSGLATRHLARADARRLVLYGAGVQARSHLDAMRAVRPVEEVVVISRGRARAEALVAEAAALGLRASVGEPGAEREADLVCTCTTSVSPVVAGERLADGVHVNAVGSYTASMRELDTDAVRRARVAVETREVAMAEAGDLVIAILEGAIEEDHVLADLSEVVRGAPVRTADADVTLFKSVGVAFEDLMVARAAVDRLGIVSRVADVVIVGGGAVGASAAYHLAVAGAGRVVLLEREDRLATGSTGACAGGFRQQFSSEVNIRLSQASVPMITGFSAEHGLPLDVVQDGYLFLVRGEALWRDFVAANRLQRSLGVDAELISPEDAGALAPGVSLEGVVGAAFGPSDGLADPSGLALGYATLARRAGAEIEVGVDVTSVRVAGDRVAGVETPDGPVDAPVVVNAAGPWAAELARTAGVELPLEPIPRHVLVTGAFPGAPRRRTLVIDAASSFYFHREGAGVLLGMGSPNERASFDMTPDERFVADELLPTAVERFPALAEAAVEHAWVGLYEMTPDRHPVIGPAPGVSGLLLANGFSGHGFQHAPVVGKLLAELVVEGAARTVDVSGLGLERFGSGDLVPEGHVV